jgi:hypothetical protein
MDAIRLHKHLMQNILQGSLQDCNSHPALMMYFRWFSAKFPIENAGYILRSHAGVVRIIPSCEKPAGVV